MKQNFVILRKTPLSALTARSDRSFPWRLVAGKAPWLAAHYVCRLARRACRSSSQKSHFVAIFGSPVCFSGHAIIKRAPPSPFLQKPYGKLGALAQKRGFACASIGSNRPQFYILHFTFYISPPRRAGFRARPAVRAFRVRPAAVPSASIHIHSKVTI